MPVENDKIVNIALVGNPNTGKTSIFNALTGLKQKVGNFPGITVDKKIGKAKINDQLSAKIIDLPGTYSIFAKSEDENVASNFLLDSNNPEKPDLVVYVADANSLKRNLILFTQILDLNLPAILVITMLDIAKNSELNIDFEQLEKTFQTKIVLADPRNKQGIDGLLNAISEADLSQQNPKKDFFTVPQILAEAIQKTKEKYKLPTDFHAFCYLTQAKKLDFLDNSQKDELESQLSEKTFDLEESLELKSIEQLTKVENLLEDITEQKPSASINQKSKKIDKILTHPILGYVSFLVILFIIFQSLFTWASYPMDWIDGFFASITENLSETLPDNLFSRFLIDGVLSGIGGIVIFIPQIAILFGIISILEDSGYMARLTIISDRIMRYFGLNGRSVIPLISGIACAVPAIMATRNIPNWKNRLITLFVTPLIPCSARLPVYTVLIALVIPNKMVLGILNLQALAMMALYVIGILAAFFFAWLMKMFIKSEEQSIFIIELPIYRMPRWKNVLLTMLQKSKIFLFSAGKIILILSIIIWVLSSFGPGNAMKNAEKEVKNAYANKVMDSDSLNQLIASKQLEASYAGKFGKFIEPAIKPLGFNWKIGIAIITSFVAREVFVGTMSTIYSIETDEASVIKRMRKDKNPDGSPFYTTAVSFSLLVFYAFAMQCMSTLAIVKRETNSWKWPILQLVFMTLLAYISSFAVFQLLS